MSDDPTLKSSETRRPLFESGSVDWYRTHFNRATLTANALAAINNSHSPPPDGWSGPVRASLALQSIRTVLDMVKQTGRGIRRGADDAVTDPVAAYADEVALPAVILAAGLALLVSDNDQISTPLRGDVKKIMGLAENVVARRSKQYRTPGDTLAIRTRTATLAAAIGDTPDLRPQAHYNLACLFAALGSTDAPDHFDTAIAHLQRAVIYSPSLRTAARSDSSLARLRRVRSVEWLAAVGHGDGD